MNVNVGDKVQIKDNAIDVTNGKRASAGVNYGVGGPYWATVIFIDNNYETFGRYDLPSVITRVMCESDSGIIVWQVQPESIAKLIRTGSPELVQIDPTPVPVSYPATDIGKVELNKTYQVSDYTPASNIDEYYSVDAFVPTKESQDLNHYDNTLDALDKTSGTLPDITPIRTQVGSTSRMGEKDEIFYPNRNKSWRNLNSRELKSIGSNSVKIDESAIEGVKFKTAWQNDGKRRQMLNNDIENIQNSEVFPSLYSTSSEMNPARYDYRVIPGDDRYKLASSLEDKLRDARASLGIQIHGNNNIARSVKYFMYNRFKVPDTNLAYNKTVTHVFFTRPDLNILNVGNKSKIRANKQTMSHSETAMLWKLHPDLFKLLTNGPRCGDHNNFNLLLSNQVSSFDILDETLTVEEVGKSWNGHSMAYGKDYTGKTGGEFTCSFNELSDYSIINLMKLWITYIDNVNSGAWSPSYNLNVGDGVASSPSIIDSHVFTKTIDYAGAAYVFKCAEDGETVLYWSKYYGIFPTNTGANALSWDASSGIGDPPKLSIKFRYCYKEDLSPISLLEFNDAANIGIDTDGKSVTSENSFNVNYNHSSRPYVGCPFIEFKLAIPSLYSGGSQFGESSYIRLKFKKHSDYRLNDDVLYKFDLGRNVYNDKLYVSKSGQKGTNLIKQERL